MTKEKLQYPMTKIGNSPFHTKNAENVSLKTMKSTLVCSIRAETGRQGSKNEIALLDLSREQVSQAILIIDHAVCTCL